MLDNIIYFDDPKFWDIINEKYSTKGGAYNKGNEHFTETSEKYIAMLLDKDNRFIPVTYEKFLSACYKHCPNNDFKTWIDYLTKRYIIQND